MTCVTIKVTIYAILALSLVQGHRENEKEGRVGRFLDKAGVCKEAGYRRNETDSSHFYRCVDYYGTGKKFSIFKFSCPATLEFNEKLLVCTNPTKPCNICETTTEFPVPIKGSTTVSALSSTSVDVWTDVIAEPLTVKPTEPTFAVTEPSSTSAVSETSSNFPIQLAVSLETNEQPSTSVEISPLDSLFTINCTSNKFYRLPNDCNRFYQCHQESVSVFSCAPGLFFDESLARCALPEESSCDQGLKDGPIAAGLVEFLEMDCSGAMHRYPFDCRHFYQCYNDGLAKSLLFYSCSVGLLFDEQTKKCLLPYETSPCYAHDSPFKSSPLFYHLQRLFHSSPNKFAFTI